MIATLTSKGQLTLPKAIREQLKLDTGAKLDVSVASDGTLRMRALTKSADDLFGLLKRPGRKPPSVARIDQQVGDFLAAKHEGIRKETANRMRAKGKRAA